MKEFINNNLIIKINKIRNQSKKKIQKKNIKKDLVNAMI